LAGLPLEEVEEERQAYITERLRSQGLKNQSGESFGIESRRFSRGNECASRILADFSTRRNATVIVPAPRYSCLARPANFIITALGSTLALYRFLNPIRENVYG